jgi:hypothetical protein
MDVLAANTPKEFTPQLDVGTVMEAGADPVAWRLGRNCGLSAKGRPALV